MGINNIVVIEQALGCWPGTVDLPLFGQISGQQPQPAAQCQRIVSNNPVIMKANAMA